MPSDTNLSWLKLIGLATFSTAVPSPASSEYLKDPAILKLIEFFEAKGLASLKTEDRQEKWYDDWLAYQAEHQIYASVLSPKEYSTRDRQFDLLKYVRMMEVLSYLSPSHAYSLQVTFLGVFSILMGTNEPLKKEAVAELEKGGLFAFGVSEKEHGSDLFGNEFTVRPDGPGRFVGNGSKYYIGNANCASMISVLARKEGGEMSAREARSPFVVFALRPSRSSGFTNLRKIHTLGVRAGYVGSFDVKDHHFPETDLVADGRAAWDAVMGTVTLGKFFLGFGSIGVCEHALAETLSHIKE